MFILAIGFYDVVYNTTEQINKQGRMYARSKDTVIVVGLVLTTFKKIL